MPTETIAVMIEKAQAAQQQIALWSVDEALHVVANIGRRILAEPCASILAELAVKETGFGSVDDTKLRLRRRILGTIYDFRLCAPETIFEPESKLGLRKIVKPVGVVAAMTAATSAPSAVICTVLPALFARNAVIVCPNPASRLTAAKAVEEIRCALADCGAPLDLCQLIESPTRAASDEIAKLANLVVAAGGRGVVSRANACGTPALTGGVGNAVVVVDRSADLRLAARSIVAGKSFDNGTSCSAESVVFVEESVERKFREELLANSAYICRTSESTDLEKILRPDGKTLNREIVGKSADFIASLAGISVPTTTSVLAASIDFSMSWRPLFGEKLCPVLALATIADLDQAIAAINYITKKEGAGHSCGIFTTEQNHVEQLANSVSVSRVMINQSTGLNNSGSFSNGLPFTVTLGCGPWGGGISNDNINWRHLTNTTTVSEPIFDYETDAIDFLKSIF